MFELSLPKLILIALVVLVLFGRGKVADLMGEFGKGVKSFKEGMNDEAVTPAAPPAPPAQIAANPPPVAAAVAPAAPVSVAPAASEHSGAGHSGTNQG